MQSQKIRILHFFLRMFDEFFSGFRDKFQKIVTCVAFSIKFAKTNQKFAENSEFCEKNSLLLVNYSLRSLVRDRPAVPASHAAGARCSCARGAAVASPSRAEARARQTTSNATSPHKSWLVRYKAPGLLERLTFFK